MTNTYSHRKCESPIISVYSLLLYMQKTIKKFHFKQVYIEVICHPISNEFI